MRLDCTVPVVLAVVTSIAAAGCRSAVSPAHLAEADYADALAAASAHRLGAGGVGIEEARAALSRYLAAAETYSPEKIGVAALELYAPEAYFNDQIKELRGARAIAEYLTRSAEMLVEPAITTDRVAESDGHFYVCWTMTFRTQRDPGARPTAAHGISHLIFGPDGRIVFQKDYWDVTTAVWERVPVLGALVRQVKRRM